MNILQDLHVSIQEALKFSFDDAFQKMELQLATSQTELRHASHSAAIASMAQQTAECKVHELQDHISALQEELYHYKETSDDYELPGNLANLEKEFAPRHIWPPDLHNVDQLKDILEHKYTALYSSLQTVMESWTSLKSKVLQHKRKLHHWDRQLQREEFTLLVDGAPVTFRRIKPASEKANQSTGSPSNSPDQALPSGSELSSDLECASLPLTEIRGLTGDSSSGTQTGDSSNQTRVINQENLCLLKQELASPGSISDALCPIPRIQSQRRKLTVQNTSAQAARQTPGPSIQVKSEPMSSSPACNSTLPLEQPYTSTQDLDDIGDTVQTPTKRNAYREVVLSHDTLPEKEPSSEPVQTVNSSVLRPVDSNTRTARLAYSNPGKKRQKVTNYQAISTMAEDNNAAQFASASQAHDSNVTGTVNARGSKRKAHDMASYGRLQGLLDEPMPPRSPLKPVDNNNEKHSEDKLKQRNDTTLELASSRSHMQLSHSQSSQSSPQVQPEDEPYRSRPLHRLNLEHFKINPAANQGFHHAYSAVVRKKDERKCLSGCTRPGCCGDRFRAMARLGGLPANASNEQDEDGQRMLEEYVGENSASLAGLNSQDREKLLVEARARMIANQYGRHRHSHQRPRTPPGFWRTDMPSTQEMEADRQTAREMEREKVEERYREALRPGGLWTWADE